MTNFQSILQWSFVKSLNTYGVFKMLKQHIPVLIYTIIFFLLFYSYSALASIEHKNLQLGNYLDQISENQQEKAGIIDIIKHNKSGSYLDIGSGRDTVSYIVENLSPSEVNHINLIAADLEGKTLTEIAKRYSEMYFNLENKSNIELSLLKMDATEMRQIKDSSIKAINASAVLHEINSYVSVKTPLDRFFSEAVRILEKDGFLVYRDPTLQSDPDIINSLVIKNDFAKKFLIIFLPKFLDKKLTQLVDMHGNSIKPEFHYEENFSIKLHMIGNSDACELNYKEFFDLPSSKINFKEEIIINAPRRLLSEIERHYVLFVKNIYPMGFIDPINIIIGSNLADITPARSKKTLLHFATSLGINYKEQLTEQDIELLTSEFRKIDSMISKGVELYNFTVPELENLKAKLQLHNISRDLYQIKKNAVWLDAKLFAIIFEQFEYHCDNGDLPLDAIRWLKREGEEYYFYLTTQQLLDYLKDFCNFYLRDTDKEGYALVPDAEFGVQYVKRDLYEDLLNRDMIQLDNKNKRQEFITSKTIIRFQLVPSRLYSKK